MCPLWEMYAMFSFRYASNSVTETVHHVPIGIRIKLKFEVKPNERKTAEIQKLIKTIQILIQNSR